MADVTFIVVQMYLLAFCMRKHGKWSTVNNLIDLFAWGILNTILFAFAKGIFLVCGMVLTGQQFSFPLVASPNLHFVSSTLAICFWTALMYWQLPGKAVRAMRSNQSEK